MNIAIAYPGGCYGHYLKWAIYTLMFTKPGQDMRVPWSLTGGSHSQDYINSTSNFAPRQLRWSEVESGFSKRFLLYTVHPQNWRTDLADVMRSASHTIALYPNQKSYLLALHNLIHKIPNSQPAEQILNYVDQQKFRDRYGYSNIFDAPRWVQRDYLSQYMFDHWESSIFWYAPNHVDANYTFVSDLIGDFVGTLNNIAAQLGIDWNRDPSELLEHHGYNVSQQEFLKQDSNAQAIIDSIDGNPIQWDSKDITVFTEAYIQKTLHERGIMLQCTDLNDFPTSTEELIEVLE